jgi:hypothetical protein
MWNTVDFKGLGCGHSVSELLQLAGGKRRKVSDALIAAVGRYTRDAILPYLNDQLQNDGCASECQLSVSDDGESIHVHYPTVSAGKRLLRDHVLVEFGGRHIIDPNAVHSMEPDIAELFKSITFPKAEKVVVLSPARTFWEKVTLIHAQCNKPMSGTAIRF